jgi:hypothetical protein
MLGPPLTSPDRHPARIVHCEGIKKRGLHRVYDMIETKPAAGDGYIRGRNGTKAAYWIVTRAT